MSIQTPPQKTANLIAGNKHSIRNNLIHRVPSRPLGDPQKTFAASEEKSRRKGKNVRKSASTLVMYGSVLGRPNVLWTTPSSSISWPRKKRKTSKNFARRRPAVLDGLDDGSEIFPWFFLFRVASTLFDNYDRFGKGNKRKEKNFGKDERCSD